MWTQALYYVKSNDDNQKSLVIVTGRCGNTQLSTLLHQICTTTRHTYAYIYVNLDKSRNDHGI